LNIFKLVGFLLWYIIDNIQWKIVFIVKGWMSMCLWSVCDSSKIWELIKWSFVACCDWFEIINGLFIDNKGYQVEDGGI